MTRRLEIIFLAVAALVAATALAAAATAGREAYPSPAGGEPIPVWGEPGTMARDQPDRERMDEISDPVGPPAEPVCTYIKSYDDGSQRCAAVLFPDGTSKSFD
jgi:hypothetical protein